MLYIMHAGAVPFYRYFNGFDHFYTTSAAEIGTTTHGHLGRHGYRSEGTQCLIHNVQAPGTVPLYRYYNGKEHFYTTNSHEIGTITPGVVGKHGYRFEGIAGYCYPSQPNIQNIPLYRGYIGGGDHFYTTDLNEIVHHKIPIEGIACYVGRI